MNLSFLFRSAPSRTSGFTLPEMMLALAATTLFAVAAFVLYGSGPTAAGADVEQEHIQSIAQNAYMAYGPLGNYSTVTTNNAITDGVIPATMVRGSGTSATAMSVWGTPVTVGGAAAGPDGLDNAGLAITYTGVPRGACPVLIDALADNMWDVQINGTSVMMDVSAGGRLGGSQGGGGVVGGGKGTVLGGGTVIGGGGGVVGGGGGGGFTVKGATNMYHVLDMDAARNACLASTKDDVPPSVTFVRYDQTAGSQLVAGADSNNLLWPPGHIIKDPGGGVGGGKGGGVVIGPPSGGDGGTVK